MLKGHGVGSIILPGDMRIVLGRPNLIRDCTAAVHDVGVTRRCPTVHADVVLHDIKDLKKSQIVGPVVGTSSARFLCNDLDLAIAFGTHALQCSFAWWP